MEAREEERENEQYLAKVDWEGHGFLYWNQVYEGHDKGVTCTTFMLL